MTGIIGSKIGLIILAAGEGKRMKSHLPKVLNEIGGKPLIFHILEQVRVVFPQASIAIVVGHNRSKVETYVRQETRFQGMTIEFVHQSERLGTGHAVRCAMKSSWGMELIKTRSAVMVLPGDSPLLTSQMIGELIKPVRRGVVLRLLSFELTDPTGYGRVIRRGKTGTALRIVEEKDATSKEKLIKEVAGLVYLFSSDFLEKYLQKLSNQNAQGEYYLPDLVALASKAGKKIEVLKWFNPADLKGVNDPWELAQANHILNERILRAWALQGVTVLDLGSVHIDVTVQLAEGVVLHPGVILAGATRVGKCSVIGPYAVLRDVDVSENCIIKTGTVAESSYLGPHTQVGPYAHLRPEVELASHVKVGNFVELKKTKIGVGSKVSHLSYLGDAVVGKDVNIGCGFITCNFDGRVIEGERKHRTLIEDGVFMGSDCQTVAPVRIGEGAFIASGSTITEDVPAEALAIGRARQVNKSGYARKLKGKQPGK